MKREMTIEDFAWPYVHARIEHEINNGCATLEANYETPEIQWDLIRLLHRPQRFIPNAVTQVIIGYEDPNFLDAAKQNIDGARIGRYRVICEISR